MNNENEMVYYQVDDDGVATLSQQWVDGMMYEREAILALLEGILEEGKVNHLSGVAVLGIVYAVVQARLENNNE